MNKPESTPTAQSSPASPAKQSRQSNPTRIPIIALVIGLLLGILIDRLVDLRAGASGVAIITSALGVAGLAFGLGTLRRASSPAPANSPTPTLQAPPFSEPATGAIPATTAANLDSSSYSASDNQAATQKIRLTPELFRVSHWATSRGPLVLNPATALTFCGGVCIAIGAQYLVDAESTTLGILMFLLAAICILIGLRGSAANPVVDGFADGAAQARTLPPEWQLRLGSVALLFGAGTFAFSSGNLYTVIGIALWALSIIVWLPAMADYRKSFAERIEPLQALSKSKPMQWIALGLLLITLVLGIGFRFANLRNNPRDMNSDHAEKLLDVKDILDGTDHIFMIRNTGREPWQFYWTVALVKLLSIPADFMALKIGTALIGCLMLPAIFLLGRELFGWRIGLIALLFAAVTSWVVILQRFGLRHGLNPAMVAWTLYFLVRGLKRGSRNAMLASGVAMGIGLQGYTPFRFMPFAYGLIVLVWGAWQWRKGNRTALPWLGKNVVLAVITTLLVIMPLFRYAVEEPDQVFLRISSRMTSAERPLEGKPIDIFISNLKNVALAFNYTRDQVWVSNLSDRPAFDPILGGILVVSVVAAIGLSFKRREPWPLLLVVTGFVMMVPSALNLAYPNENPSTARIAGAMPMLVVICALIPGLLWEWASTGLATAAISTSTRPANPASRTLTNLLSGVTAVAISLGVLGLNYQRVFRDYPEQYCRGAQNASDIASEMALFVARGNDARNAFLVGHPYWVDSRAVGIFIGDINFSQVVGASVGAAPVTSAQLVNSNDRGWFALAPDDIEDLTALQAQYPQGVARVVYSPVCPKDKTFTVFETQP